MATHHPVAIHFFEDYNAIYFLLDCDMIYVYCSFEVVLEYIGVISCLCAIYVRGFSQIRCTLALSTWIPGALHLNTLPTPPPMTLIYNLCSTIVVGFYKIPTLLRAIIIGMFGFPLLLTLMLKSRPDWHKGHGLPSGTAINRVLK